MKITDTLSAISNSESANTIHGIGSSSQSLRQQAILYVDDIQHNAILLLCEMTPKLANIVSIIEPLCEDPLKLDGNWAYTIVHSLIQVAFGTGSTEQLDPPDKNACIKYSVKRCKDLVKWCNCHWQVNVPQSKSTLIHSRLQ